MQRNPFSRPFLGLGSLTMYGLNIFSLPMSNVHYDLDINFKSHDQILSQMFEVPIVIHKMTLVLRSNLHLRGKDQTMTSVSRSNCYPRGRD